MHRCVYKIGARSNAEIITGDNNGNGCTPAQLAASHAYHSQDPESKIKYLDIQKIIETHVCNSKKKTIQKSTQSPVSIVKCLIANSAIYESVNASSQDVKLANNDEAPVESQMAGDKVKHQSLSFN